MPGNRLLRLRADEDDACRRFFEPSPFFLAHTLAVAEAAIQLSEICSATGMRLTALELEPDCWRSYRSRGVHRTLKPDLYAAAVSDDCEDRWFLEVDLDTESSKKVKEKCEWYHQYYRSGIEQEKHGMFPLTIWIVPNADRKERLAVPSAGSLCRRAGEALHRDHDRRAAGAASEGRKSRCAVLNNPTYRRTP